MTKVFLFLPVPKVSGTAAYIESYPYGPSPSGFHTDLGIEIVPTAENLAIAVVDGLVRFIPDPVGTPGPPTGSLVLKPDLNAVKDLTKTLGSPASMVFVYRNLAAESIRSMGAFLRLKPDPELAYLFPGEEVVAGRASMGVKAGEVIGWASTKGGVGGRSLLGFEIVYVPGGLGPPEPAYSKGTKPSDTAWTRLTELVSRSLDVSTARRLDPIFFYTKISKSGGPATIDSTHVAHPILKSSVTTQRILIEIRDEYDLPYEGNEVTIDGPSGSVGNPIPADSRSTFAFKGTPGVLTTFTVKMLNHVLTYLPSGTFASAIQNDAFIAPSHWALQGIFMKLDSFLPPEEESKSWFHPNKDPLPRYTEKNLVEPIIDGLDVFSEYVKNINSAIKYAKSFTSGDSRIKPFIFLAGWYLDHTFELLPGDHSSTIAALTKNASDAGVMVRAILTEKPFLVDLGLSIPSDANRLAVNYINSLPRAPKGDAFAQFDKNLPGMTGTHHQKFLSVNGDEGAVAFCGGVDISSDRLDSSEHGAPGPFHDVHARVEGPAVKNIYRAFVDRWNSNAKSAELLTNPSLSYHLGLPGGQVYVQVACTYSPAKRYDFAPSGSLTPKNAFLRAVSKAKKYIYIEDQYAFPYNSSDGDTLGVVKELLLALERITYLIIVIPNHTANPQARYRRQQFIGKLKSESKYPSKVSVFYLKRPDHLSSSDSELATSYEKSASGGELYPNEIYVHSKVWIVDDICAKIGSANMNRRSYTNDSEMDLVMVDGELEDGVRAFALNLRLKLWKEHLRRPSSVLRDWKRARVFWQPLPSNRIAEYKEDIDATGPEAGDIISGKAEDLKWGKIDPDGR